MDIPLSSTVVSGLLPGTGAVTTDSVRTGFHDTGKNQDSGSQRILEIVNRKEKNDVGGEDRDPYRICDR